MSLVRSLCVCITFISCLISSVHGQTAARPGPVSGTRIGFYSTTCPTVETIVRNAVRAGFNSNPRIAPGILRMHFHDCFVQGCDGSILISGSNTERTAVPNLNLRGFEVIDNAKTQLEAACPGVVSCADILALAARDTVVLTRGLGWQVPTGRRDGRVSLASNANNLPGPVDSVAVQQKKFSDVGLNTRDLVVLAAVTAQGNRGGGRRPRVGNYGNRCRNVESVVRSVVQSHFRSNPANAPGILRMHFHDCFVNGCDGSILVAGNTSERTAVPNRPLRGFEAIEEAKTRLENACPNTVSCADILTLAARDAVVWTGGQGWSVPLGRLDGRRSEASDVNLPGPSDTVAKQKQDFAAKNLNTLDLVTLVGGHTIGTAGCGLVRGRFFNFNGTGQPDPSIDPSFVPLVQARCPQNGDATTRVDLDTGSAGDFDTSFLRNVRSSRVVLQSDLFLWGDTDTRSIIERFLGLRRPILRFGPEFGKSMTKMSLIEVKTGTDGEIRRVCSAIN